MNLYQLKYWRDGCFKKTKADYFVTIPDGVTLNQFIIDEEKRSGYTVYCKPANEGDYDLVLFSRISCSPPDAESVSVAIYTPNEDKVDVLRH